MDSQGVSSINLKSLIQVKFYLFLNLPDTREINEKSTDNIVFGTQRLAFYSSLPFI